MGRIIEQDDSSSQEADLRLRVRELPELAVGQQYVLLDGHVVVGMLRDPPISPHHRAV